MELIINHDLATIQSEFHRPRIFTLDLVGRLGIVNAAARRLRALGLRIVDEDAAPNDGSLPIIAINLNGVALEDLRNLCDVSTLHMQGDRPAQLTGVFLGARILVPLGAQQQGACHA